MYCVFSHRRRQRDYLKMRSRNYEDHDIETYTISTPIGDMFIKSCSYGLHSVSDNNAAEENFKPVQRCVFYVVSSEVKLSLNTSTLFFVQSKFLEL